MVGLLLFSATGLLSCEEEEVKPNWELTSAKWTKPGLYYLEIKVKNNTGKRATYLGIEVLLKSGSTIKKKATYACTTSIIPNEEYTFSSSGIYLTTAEYEELKNCSVELGHITDLY